MTDKIEQRLKEIEALAGKPKWLDAHEITELREQSTALCKALRRAVDFLDVLGSDIIKTDIAAILSGEQEISKTTQP